MCNISEWWQVCTSSYIWGVWGPNFDMSMQKLAILTWLISCYYQDGSLTCSNHNTQHNRTHNNQHEQLPPYPLADLPFLSMGRAAVPSNLGTATPHESIACARWRVRDKRSWFLCLGRQKRNPSRKRERGRAQALGGCCSIIWHNNQPKHSVGGGEGIWEEMQPGRNMWGAMFACCLSCWTEQQQIIEIKYIMAFVGHQMTNGHNNQPKTHGHNQGGTGEEVWQGGSTGRVQSHCFGSNRCWNNGTK